MMTAKEIKTIMEELEDDYTYVGLRYEEKEYQVGDIIADSKHNPDREDEREFPDFDSEEYDALPELPGVSTWNTQSDGVKKFENLQRYNSHAYIVVGDRGWFDSIGEHVLDDDELVIEDGKVAMVLM